MFIEHLYNWNYLEHWKCHAKPNKQRKTKHKEASSILYTFMTETKNFQKPALSKQNWA